MNRRAQLESKPAQLRNIPCRLLPDALEIRRELSAIVAGAVSSVCLTMYIFSDDESGHSVLSELVHAALRGVRVRIIIDGFGSAFTPDRFFAPLRQAGGLIQRFNTHWHPRYLFRNHQKFVSAAPSNVRVAKLNLIPDKLLKSFFTPNG